MLRAFFDAILLELESNYSESEEKQSLANLLQFRRQGDSLPINTCFSSHAPPTPIASPLCCPSILSLWPVGCCPLAFQEEVLSSSWGVPGGAIVNPISMLCI